MKIEEDMDKAAAFPACEECDRSVEAKNLTLAWLEKDGVVTSALFVCQGEDSCMQRIERRHAAVRDAPLHWFTKNIRDSLVAQTPAIFITRLHEQYKPTPEASMQIMKRACLIESWLRTRQLR